MKIINISEHKADMLALQTSLQFAISKFGKSSLARVTPASLGALVAVVAYHLRQLYDNADPADFKAFLKLIRLKVLKGSFYWPVFVIEVIPPYIELCSSSNDDFDPHKFDEPDDPKVANTVIYQIENINIYLTAEVVQQLNVNPKEVINMIQEKIKEEIENTKANT